MTLSVEHRFGHVNALGEPIEWLNDNGSCYTAHDARQFAHNIGLVPCTTRVENPQSNGMAVAFVRTLKRDYACVNPRPDARTVIDQLPGWLAQNNAVHPHRALGYRSPSEFSLAQPDRTDQGFRGQQHQYIRGLAGTAITLRIKYVDIFVDLPALSCGGDPSLRTADYDQSDLTANDIDQVVATALPSRDKINSDHIIFRDTRGGIGDWFRW